MLKVPPKHIPSPVQACQEVFLLGPVQEYLECETLGEHKLLVRFAGGKV